MYVCIYASTYVAMSACLLSACLSVYLPTYLLSSCPHLPLTCLPGKIRSSASSSPASRRTTGHDLNRSELSVFLPTCLPTYLSFYPHLPLTCLPGKIRSRASSSPASRRTTGHNLNRSELSVFLPTCLPTYLPTCPIHIYPSPVFQVRSDPGPPPPPPPPAERRATI